MRTAFVVVMLAVVAPASAQTGSPGGNWDAAAAAAYLDARMDAWFANGTRLKTGDTQTACVSCQAGLAYALSRPVLRRVMHVDTPAAQEARLLDETTRRVDTYQVQHLYNRTWALLASTRLPRIVTEAQRAALIDELVRAQREDGGWSLASMGPWRWSRTAPPVKSPGALDASLVAQSDGYATGLVVYTLKQAGVAPGHAAIRKGLRPRTWRREGRTVAAALHVRHRDGVRHPRTERFLVTRAGH